MDTEVCPDPVMQKSSIFLLSCFLVTLQLLAHKSYAQHTKPVAATEIANDLDLLKLRLDKKLNDVKETAGALKKAKDSVQIEALLSRYNELLITEDKLHEAFKKALSDNPRHQQLIKEYEKYKAKYDRQLNRLHSKQDELKAYSEYVRLDSTRRNELIASGQDYVESQFNKAFKDFSELKNNPEGDGLLSPQADAKELAAYEELVGDAFELNPEELKNKEYTNGLVRLKDKVGLIKDTHIDLGDLKKKYRSIGNLDDPSTRVKVNSMDGEGFGERFVVGGMVQFLPGRNGFSLDVNPWLAYRVHRGFRIGLGATFRARLGRVRTKTNHEQGHVFGYRVFAEKNVLRRLFGHVEYERLHRSAVPDQDGLLRDITSKSILIGLGKEFKVLKNINARLLWLYNIGHDQNSPHAQPWLVRFGFTINQLKTDK